MIVRHKLYCVYIAVNTGNTVLYTGISGDLPGRMYQHKNKLSPGFTSRYNVNKLVYFEAFEDPAAAIVREKEIKGWVRKKKVTLVESLNPKWLDLTDSL